jgi:hypothetical protein
MNTMTSGNMESFFPPPPRPYSPYAPFRTVAKKSAPKRRPHWVDRDAPPPTTSSARETEIERIARQLARVAQTVPWGRVQNDEWDRLCPFIFRLRSLDGVRNRLERVGLPDAGERVEFVNYALRRWYCFWGARLGELLFQTHPGVKPGPPKDHEIDFTIDGVPFDLKTSEMPRIFAGRLREVDQDPGELATWLFQNQSRERRFHLANRLFLVLCDPAEPDQAWRLRADVGALRLAIADFMASRSFFEIAIPTGGNGFERATTGVIIVRRPPGPRQLRMSLTATRGAGVPVPRSAVPRGNSQLGLPLLTEAKPDTSPSF